MEDKELEDRILTCVDCGREFTFSVGEQEFFYSKFPPLSDPKRCKECRVRRKATIRREDEGGSNDYVIPKW